MNIQQIEDQNLIPIYQKRDIVLVKGNGCYLFDENNNEYLDLASNYGANILGYNNINFNNALKSQIDRLTNCHSSFYNDTRAALLSKLNNLFPNFKSFICNTGTESVEAALKFAKIISNKDEIISAKRSYHGRTLGALSATGIPKYQKPFQPLIPNFKQINFNDINDLIKNISHNTAAILLEPIQGESGVNIPNINYLKQVKNLCVKNNILLILDEIQTGFRTGKYLAADHFNVEPDIFCLSKGLGNGFPVALTLVHNNVFNNIARGSHGTTFGSNPMACAASLKTLEEIANNQLLQNSKNMGEYFLIKLNNINSPIVREVRGLGLMIAIELKQKAGKYVKALQEEGILVMSNNNIIRLLPPLIITKEEIDLALKKFNKILC
ncbi:MAG: aspartate aminotransferase family protein [Patescibacteria group bacterium]